MTTFQVWAPRAQQVQLDLHGSLVDMKRGKNGWYAVDVDTRGLDVDYAFRLDGHHTPFPDPRSPYQPHGVLGPSRTVDHSHFDWTDGLFRAKPISSAIIYEIHIGTFTPAGTFESAIERLDYLAALGITHIELMPVAEFPGKRGWGYDGADFFAPHHAYGGPEGLKRFVNAFHACGIAVILDVVYNHIGPTGNFLDQFGPYFLDEHPGRWGQPFNFCEAHSDEVRRFFLDNIRTWFLDYHMDGLRIDAIQAMIDYSAYPLLEEMCAEADAIEAHAGRPLIMIAESDLNDPRVVRSRDAHGFGLDAQWIDDFHHALHAYLTGQSTGYFKGFGTLGVLAHTLTKGYYYSGNYCSYRERRHGRPSTGLSAHKFVGFLQNHDQIGNRYAGERSAHYLTLGQVKIAAAFVLLGPYIPLLFMGEEWGASTPFLYFTDHEDPELARSVSIGRQKDFEKIDWNPDLAVDPQDPQTMEKSKLIWDEISAEPHRSLFEWHKMLIGLRREFPALTDGRLDRVHVRFDEEAQWMLIQRTDIEIAANFSLENRNVPINCKTSLIISSESGIKLSDDSIEMPSHSVAILRVLQGGNG